jgi:hypothetical protein
MNESRSVSRAYEALAAGNVALMNVRFDERYAVTFEEYQRLIERRRTVMSSARTEESELLLTALNTHIWQYAAELER